MAKAKVLVADDGMVERYVFQRMLEKHGHDVFCVASGAEAITYAERERPDIIFLDIVMADMNGYEACRELNNNASTSNIPVIMVSGKDQLADKVWARRQGAQGYITKPFSEERILKTVSRFNRSHS